jgi:hypothetical protein
MHAQYGAQAERGNLQSGAAEASVVYGMLLSSGDGVRG